MPTPFEVLRREVLRRVRYAGDTVALRDNRLPPEAPFDAALTNGLLAIAAHEWPGEEVRGDWSLAASELLRVVHTHGNPLAYIDREVLLDAETC
jgi:hypothetical protein